MPTGVSEEDQQIARAVSRKLSRDHPDRRDDMYQDALIAIWKLGDAPRQWKYSAARSAVIDGERKYSHYRSDRVRRVRFVSITATEFLARRVELAFEDRVADESLTDCVDRLVNCRCDERVREILVRLYYGQSKAEIAAVLGISPGRVSQLLRPIKAA